MAVMENPKGKFVRVKEDYTTKKNVKIYKHSVGVIEDYNIHTGHLKVNFIDNVITPISHKEWLPNYQLEYIDTDTECYANQIKIVAPCNFLEHIPRHILEEEEEVVLLYNEFVRVLKRNHYLGTENKSLRKGITIAVDELIEYEDKIASLEERLEEREQNVNQLLEKLDEMNSQMERLIGVAQYRPFDPHKGL